MQVKYYSFGKNNEFKLIGYRFPLKFVNILAANLKF